MALRLNLLLGALAGLLGLLVSLWLAPAWTWTARGLVAWDVAALVYLLRTFVVMATSDGATRRRRAIEQDPGAVGVLGLSVTATLASVVAIVAELGQSAGWAQRAGCAVTLVLSFVFVHTAFALHYAHGHERAVARGQGGLHFPGEPSPDYWDFVYFAFVIGIAAQTADVSIESRHLRRVALVHGVLSFFFNTTVLAVAVGAASSAL